MRLRRRIGESMIKGREIWAILKETFTEFGNDGGSSLAAAIAYYTAFSLPPLLFLLVWVARLVFDPQQVQEAMSSQMEGLLGGTGSELITEMMTSAGKKAAGGGVGAVVGILALLFGATGAFVELQRALNRAWNVVPSEESGGVKGFLTKRVLSLGMLLGIAFLLLVSLAVSAAISLLGAWIAGNIFGVGPAFLWVVDIILSVSIFTLLIGLIFKILPDAELSFGDVRAGALVTAVLFVVGKFAIGLYLGEGDVGSLFGAAGPLAIILTWIYYSAMIFLIGAEFTQVWARRHGRAIEPEEGATRIG